MSENLSIKYEGQTGIVIRFDDIAPNMNWEMMDKCETILNKFNIKPVLGVIPNNKDEELLNYPEREEFWDTVKKWELDNWTIAMHGYTHVYDKETNKMDFFGYGGRSEFCGHSLVEQNSRLKKGLQIFRENNIKIKTFFSPNHTYDTNTFEALINNNIYQVIDGYGLSPYEYKNIRFMPQLFYKLLMFPYGIQSTQIHLNYWKNEDFEHFKKFIEKNYRKIISLDEAFSRTNNRFINKILNILLEKTLKFKRKFF